MMSILCGMLIYFSVNMWCATLAFWITDTGSAMMLTQNVSEFSKYPAAIYGTGVQVLITFLLPFAFTSFYPSVFVLGMDSSFVYWGGTLVATVVCLVITGVFWKYGLSKYQSAGG